MYMTELAPGLPLAWCRSTEDGTQQRYAEVSDKNHLHAEGPQGCIFCVPRPEEVVERGDNLYVIQNIFPYELWDRFDVKDQKMIVPNDHVDNLGDLSRDTQLEWLDTVVKYERQGYSNYTRDPSNPSKSKEHLHTHIIALGGRALLTQRYDVPSYSNVIRFQE